MPSEQGSSQVPLRSTSGGRLLREIPTPWAVPYTLFQVGEMSMSILIYQ
jgi:hypothetical protein